MKTTTQKKGNKEKQANANTLAVIKSQINKKPDCYTVWIQADFVYFSQNMKSVNTASAFSPQLQQHRSTAFLRRFIK